MKLSLKKFALGAGTIALVMAVPTTATAQSSDFDLVPDSWIFVMQADVSASTLDGQIMSAMGKGKAKDKGKIKHVYRNSLKGFSTTEMSAQAARELANSLDGVAYLVPNSYLYVTGRRNAGGGKPGAGTQTVPYGITRVNGGTYKGNAIAWVVDTGVDARHPDLRVHKGKSTSIIDSSRGLTDGQGHGTHVAGIIGARDNDFGVIGVAPGVTIASVKVLDNDGKGTADTIIAGLDYAASKARSGDVINLSLSGGFNQAVNDAVLRASQSATVVVAAGNYRGDARNYSPASTEGSNVMTVSAMDQQDAFNQSSNFGNPPIDCVAPGVDIMSTAPGGNYASFTGTSMAAPHVSGLVLKGNISFDGVVSYDRDSSPDPICVF